MAATDDDRIAVGTGFRHLMLSRDAAALWKYGRKKR
jgi:hypothetical protein